MRKRFLGSILAAIASLGLSFSAIAQTGGQQPHTQNAKVAAAPRRDLSGVWSTGAVSGGEGPAGNRPPMTPWAQAKFDAAKPGYGPRAAPGGNDPILQCDPMGFPRIIFFLTSFEFAAIPGRTLMFFERDHAWREIWTDGRALPKDPDPTWYGYAVGKWEDDYTFVVDSVGFDERTWLGGEGQPHSDAMRLRERYHRADHDTIEFNLTIDDPQAYTKTWVAAPRILKLKPKAEILPSFCVWSEENAFTQRIRMPAVSPNQDNQKK